LPSPTIPFQHANNTSSSSRTTTTTRTISGVFIDPTGCHVFISSYNGEAYYLHSSSKRVVKLPGFGSGVGSMNTPDSYITAVAWDKERGTEGSTKRILLGTNHGEIYEYSLTASSFYSNDNSNNKKKDKDGEAGGENDTKKKDDPKNNNTLSSSPSLDTEDMKVPVLLYVLKTTTFKSNNKKKKEEVLVPVDTPITGMHFERSQGGNQVTILVVTSGKRRSTMFHTFQGNSTDPQQQQHTTQQSIMSSVGRNDNMALLFRNAFSSSSTTSPKHCNTIRLSGSIDFADLKICQDSFAIRTEVGIYYGSIHKKSLTTTLAAASQEDEDEEEFGLLPYDKISNNMMMMRKKHSMKNNNIEPVSISLTPHHFITLKSDGEVTFINRVSCKPIQRERVVDYYNTNNNNELIMDVRRPDQVWLRQGYTLMHISSSMEDRDVWRYSLERCLIGGKNSTFTSKSSSTFHHHQEEKKEDLAFEVTKSLCSNSTQKSIVGVIRAEYHLARGRPEMAAKHFAQAPSILSPFSSIATRLALPSLLGNGEEEKASTSYNNKALHTYSNESRELLAHSNVALITYLMDKFRQASSKNDLVQCAMLGAWLVELYLHEKEREDNNNNNKKKKRSGAGPYNNSSTSTHTNKTIPTLGSFLSNNYQYLDVQTTIRILSSHDAKASDCATYAANSGDLKTAINACFSCTNGDLGLGGGEGGSKAGAMDALKILNDTSLELAEPFYYKHAYTLLCRAPMQAARSFLARYPHGLLPTKLLPAFMNYERKRMEVKKERLVELLEQDGEEHEDHNNNIMESTASSPHNHNRNTSSSTKEPVKDIVIGSSGVEVSFDRKRLSPNKKPMLNDYFVEDDKAVIKYLEGAIKLGCQNTAVYNYLISLYAAMEDEGPLFRFLSANVPPSSTSVMLSAVQQNQQHSNTTNSTKFNSSNYSSTSSSSSKIDLSHALRVVIKTGRHFRSAVKLYMGFGLRQQAVELALKVDPTLARELARESVEEEERKRLWLMIARSAAADDSTSEGEVHNSNKNKRGRDVVAKVVSVIKDCGSDVLSIEDVLPFLPDFAQIDEFKEEICSALTSYSSKIDQYMKEMNECDLTCDMLRNEIHRLRTHDTNLLPNAKCAFSDKYVLHQDEPFYVFPSGFVILQTALEKEVKMFLNEGQKKKLEEIERQLKDYLVLLSSNTNNTNSNRSHNNNNVVLSKEEIRRKMDDLQKEMDGLIAAECPLTGSVMVESIDRTFLESLEEDEEYE